MVETCIGGATAGCVLTWSSACTERDASDNSLPKASASWSGLATAAPARRASLVPFAEAMVVWLCLSAALYIQYVCRSRCVSYSRRWKALKMLKRDEENERRAPFTLLRLGSNSQDTPYPIAVIRFDIGGGALHSSSIAVGLVIFRAPLALLWGCNGTWDRYAPRIPSTLLSFIRCHPSHAGCRTGPRSHARPLADGSATKTRASD